MVIPALIPLGVRAAFPESTAPPPVEVPVEADGTDAEGAGSEDSTGVVELSEGAGETAAPATELEVGWTIVPDA